VLGSPRARRPASFLYCFGAGMTDFLIMSYDVNSAWQKFGVRWPDGEKLERLSVVSFEIMLMFLLLDYSELRPDTRKKNWYFYKKIEIFPPKLKFIEDVYRFFTFALIPTTSRPGTITGLNWKTLTAACVLKIIVLHTSFFLTILFKCRIYYYRPTVDLTSASVWPDTAPATEPWKSRHHPTDHCTESTRYNFAQVIMVWLFEMISIPRFSAETRFK